MAEQECPGKPEEYGYQGKIEGYEVYVRYAGEGPSTEEAWALFQEACSHLIYRGLAGLGEEMER